MKDSERNGAGSREGTRLGRAGIGGGLLGVVLLLDVVEEECFVGVVGSDADFPAAALRVATGEEL